MAFRRRTVRRARRSNGRRRRSFKRTTGRKRGSSQRLTKAMFKSPIMPDRLYVKLRFHETVSWNDVTGTWNYLYRGNNIYDPNRTGTGGVVTGSSQWFAFYKRCTVLGAKLTFSGVNTSNGVVSGIVFPYRENDTGTSGVDPEEQTIRSVRFITQAGGGSTPRFTNKLYLSTSKIFGISKAQVKGDFDDYAHVAAGSTQREWGFNLHQEATTGGTVSGVGIVYIDYYCMFTSKYLNLTQ